MAPGPDVGETPSPPVRHPEVPPVRQQQQAGYRVLPIEKLDNGGWLSRLSAGADNSALSGNWDDVKYFSDLALLKRTLRP
ncbi:hypothetical protein [Corallococcus exiguus]|uniref:hypothetical protein n=1 Tax=Corallococcus exiguus TaxID=83462 RepID=UPI0014708F31|nr:hypothetical protein [Corallococcus exiguus]NNB88571.1 hypothetical protein [Corallococcus exiguus]